MMQMRDGLVGSFVIAMVNPAMICHDAGRGGGFSCAQSPRVRDKAGRESFAYAPCTQTPLFVASNARHSPVCASISGVLTRLSGQGKNSQSLKTTPDRACARYPHGGGESWGGWDRAAGVGAVTQAPTRASSRQAVQRLLGKLKTAPSRTPAEGQRCVMVLRLV